MNKFKKTLITAIIFIVVGIIGSIISGFYIAPKVAAEVYRVQREVRNATLVEREVFVTEEAVEILDISALKGRDFDVEIKPSMDNKTRVKVYEYYDNSIKLDTIYDNTNKKLIVNGERILNELLDSKNLKSFMEKGYDFMIGTIVEEANNTNQVVIEVPTCVDVSFKGNNYTNLIVKDSAVLKDNLSFACNYGYVDLPLNNSLKNIDIKTEAYFEIDVKEFINAEKVNIEASQVFVTSRGFENEYVNINKFPSDVSIFGRHKVDVESFIPLGINVTISSDYVEYDSNFEAYPVNLQLRGNAGSNAEYSDRMIGEFDRYMDSKKFQGILGYGNAADYNLNIGKFYNCEIENLSNLEIEAELRDY